MKIAIVAAIACSLLGNTVGAAVSEARGAPDKATSSHIPWSEAEVVSDVLFDDDSGAVGDEAQAFGDLVDNATNPLEKTRRSSTKGSTEQNDTPPKSNETSNSTVLNVMISLGLGSDTSTSGEGGLLGGLVGNLLDRLAGIEGDGVVPALEKKLLGLLSGKLPRREIRKIIRQLLRGIKSPVDPATATELAEKLRNLLSGKLAKPDIEKITSQFLSGLTDTGTTIMITLTDDLSDQLRDLLSGQLPADQVDNLVKQLLAGLPQALDFKSFIELTKKLRNLLSTKLPLDKINNLLGQLLGGLSGAAEPNGLADLSKKLRDLLAGKLPRDQVSGVIDEILGGLKGTVDPATLADLTKKLHDCFSAYQPSRNYKPSDEIRAGLRGIFGGVQSIVHDVIDILDGIILGLGGGVVSATYAASTGIAVLLEDLTGGELNI